MLPIQTQDRIRELAIDEEKRYQLARKSWLRDSTVMGIAAFAVTFLIIAGCGIWTCITTPIEQIMRPDTLPFMLAFTVLPLFIAGILLLIARTVHLRHCKRSTPGCIMMYGDHLLHAAWMKYEFETPGSEDLGDMEVSAAQLGSIKVLYHEKEHTAWIVATDEGAIRDFTLHDATWEDRRDIVKSSVDNTIGQTGESADLFGLADVYEEDIATFLDGLGCPRETINEPIDLVLNRWRVNDTN